MLEDLHPAAALIKSEFVKGKHRYEVVSASTGISLQRLKNIMVGRSDITMRERDLLCKYLGMSPVVLFMKRGDLFNREEHLDLRGLPDDMRKVLILLHNQICVLCGKHNEPIKDRNEDRKTGC